jgi:ADP-ribose pyrophosphatase YjhB (NUDIX family)
MYIDTVPNRGSHPTYLLRESIRENGEVKKRTLANLKDWPLKRIELAKKLFKGELDKINLNHACHRNPIPTVDIIIEISTVEKSGIVLIERRNPPYGWAIPGGFVDYGESLEQAAIREALEETSLNVKLQHQFHTYSDPERDPRQHTITTVYIATASGTPKAADDAINLDIFQENNLPSPIVFDHQLIIQDYFKERSNNNSRGAL